MDMAQAQKTEVPIIELAKKAYNFVANLPNPPKFKKTDTSWHDSMVKEANEGFRKRAESERKVVAGPTKKKTMAKKKATLKSAPKKATTKR
jgi:hypothetical protein